MLTKRLALLLSLALFGKASPAAAETPDTLRLDYFHGGTATEERFSIDRLVREPLPWPGNPDRPLDSTFRGKYAFAIVPQGATEPGYTRSFSSIYGEWETTGEAREIRRSFEESLRFPDPGIPFHLVISKRNGNNDFEEIWRTELDPSDYLVHEESAAYATEVIPIVENGAPAHKVDLLLLGDGYTAGETAAFVERAKALTDVLFRTSPFRERRQDFNVWALAPAAKISGISRPSAGVYRDSPLGTRYDAFRSERYVLTFDNSSLRRIASSAPYDFIEILTNSETYGGGGIYGLWSTAAANNEWAPYLFVHEFAHHFAGLADEYYTSAVAYEAGEDILEPYEPNVTALLDPDELKWKHRIDPATPMPTPWPKEIYERHANAYQARRRALRAANAPETEMNALFRDNQTYVEALFDAAPFSDAIGAFEGALYQSTGYYRPAMNCVMFTRSDDFCEVCRDALTLVIDAYTDR